jgi:hypothetical protein
MKRNMSNTDRILRAIVAALFTYLYFSGIITGGLGILLLVLRPCSCSQASLPSAQCIGY